MSHSQLRRRSPVDGVPTLRGKAGPLPNADAAASRPSLVKQNWRFGAAVAGRDG